MTKPSLRPRVERLEEDMTAVTDTLVDIKEVLDEHTVRLDQHTVILTDHTRILTDHTRILDDHTRILTEHGQQIASIQATLLDHGEMLTEILRRLDAA